MVKLRDRRTADIPPRTRRDRRGPRAAQTGSDCRGDLVDLIGIEPMTSSMPWKRAPSCATGPHLDGSLIVVYGIKFVKRTHDPKHWQRPPRLPHRHMNMFVPSRTNFLMVLSAALSFACLPAFAQLAGVSATPVGTPITTSAIVQPALA